MAEKVELPPGVSKEQAEKVLKEQPVVFTEIETGYNSKIQIRKNFYKGKELFGIQRFWREDETKDWQFGKAIDFPEESIDEVIEGFTKMKAYLEAR